MKKLAIIVLILALCACASGPYIDLGNCGNRAACVAGAIHYAYPDMQTEMVRSTVNGVPHVECYALIDGKWRRAVLVDMDFKPDIIEFREEL